GSRSARSSASSFSARNASFLTLYSPVIWRTISSESETTSSSSTPRSTALRRPSIRPRYSATLFVATPIVSPRASRTVPSSASSTYPYAAGPGLPRAPPSVESFAFTRVDRGRRRPLRRDARQAALRRRPRRGRLERRSRRGAPASALRGRPRRSSAPFPRRRGTCRCPPCTRSSARSCRSGRRPRRRRRLVSHPALPPGRTRRACAGPRSRLDRGTRGNAASMARLEVVPRPTPAERYDAAVEVDVDEALTVHAATIEDWVAPRQAWELTLREGTDFDRPNNVEAVVLFAIGEQTSSLTFRLDQLDRVED